MERRRKNTEIKTIRSEWISEVIPVRDPEAHKGVFGRVLIAAGGAGMAGAAIFASRAALRTGSGLVYVTPAASCIPVLQTAAPEAICLSWEASMEMIARTDAPWTFDAVCFGPGMGTGAAREKLRSLLRFYKGPVVIDADGLNIIAEVPAIREQILNDPGSIIMTPHIGEARRLIQGYGVDVPEDREDMACLLAALYRCIIVLKGAGTLIARPDGDLADAVEVWCNPTGNPGVATAGSGDVLTGVIGSLTGQSLTSWDAARAGVFVHGYAGDMACAEKGERGMIASDIVESLPYALKELTGR